MTKILIDEATVKLALEALNGATRYGAGGFEDAKDALQEALAEQPAPQPEQEPVAELLKQSRANFERNFGKGGQGWADWIYGDIAELLSEHTLPPQRKPLSYEREIALREGYFADAEKKYFEARADCLNTVQNCKLFEAGFNRGWEAAHNIKGETT